MTRNDLKTGYLVKREDEEVEMVVKAGENEVLLSLNGVSQLGLYHQDLTHKIRSDFDIIEVREIRGFSDMDYAYYDIIFPSCPLHWKRDD